MQKKHKQKTLKLYVKYMVSMRCRMTVKSVLDALGLQYEKILLGEIDIVGIVTNEQRAQLKEGLSKSGLELMDDKRNVLVDKVKEIIEKMVYSENKPREIKNSDYISSQLDVDYAYVSNVFSEVTGATIEQFIITQKIKCIKKLLLHGEYNLAEIAFRLNYSSVAHLCYQFKKATGFTPTYYKKLSNNRCTVRICE